MTFREKLADWISGGKISCLTIANLELEEMNESLEGNFLFESRYSQGLLDTSYKYADTIHGILDYVSTQKSGTAKKVTRMCREALGE